MGAIDADALMQSLGITDPDCPKCGWYKKSSRRCSRGGDFEDACCAIEDAPTVELGSHWIPCSERLPEKDTCFYLATVANHGLNFTTTLPDDVDVVRWDYDRRKGYNSWHWCTERTVIAWMPLPEPYKGDE